MWQLAGFVGEKKKTKKLGHFDFISYFCRRKETFAIDSMKFHTKIINHNKIATTMKQRVLSLFIALLGIAAGAQADNLKVGGVELTPGETYTSESGIPALTSGKIIYTEDKVVILDNVTLTTYEDNGLDCSVWPELTLTLVGNNTIQGPTNGIYTERSLNINGTGTLHISECTYGIDNHDMPLTITDAHIKTEGYRLGMRRAGMLHMEGCAILEARGGEGYESIGNISGIDGEGFCVTTPEGGKVKDNYVVDASDDIVKNSWVVIQKIIAINETTFPDANFRSHILAQTYGKDGILTSEELAGVSYMSLSEKNISNLKGIEHFTALETMACNGNQLTALDISKQAVLMILDCSSNKLTALDVSQNKKLQELSCDDNELTTLDVTENKALTKLNCAKNQLSVIYVAEDVPLSSLNISKNHMRGWYMDVLLDNLYNRFGMEIGNLFVCDDEAADGNVMTPDQVAAAKAKGWKPMINDGSWVSYEGALPIDEDTFPDENFRNWILKQDYGKDGSLSDEEIAAITEIRVRGKHIANLKGIELFTALTELDCSYNQLTSLDVSKNTALTHLYCSDSQLNTLDLSNNIALEVLNCGRNKLTSLDVSKSTALTELNCEGNQLTTLDVSHNTALTDLECEGNQLTSLDVSGCTALTELNCSLNQLTSLDVSQNTALTELYCAGNRLTSLDVSKNLNLNTIVCYFNAIRGEGMATLVNSLPDVRGTGGTLFPYVSFSYEGYEEKNEITVLQVAAAKDMGWKVLMPVLKGEVTDFVDYEGVKVDAKVAYSTATASVVFGAEFTAPTLTVTPESLKGSVTFTSSNEAVAKVSASGEVSIIGVGETTITAKFAGDDTYNAAEASYKLTVTVATATMAFKSTECSTTVGTSFKSPELTTTPASLKVKYSSSNTDIATVDEETGVVVAKTEGEVTITATSADANYTGSASYKLTITRNECEMTFASATATATYGADFTAPAFVMVPKSLKGSVTFTSSNEAVAKVSASGEVSIIGVGETTITAKFAGDGTYAAASASYILTVKKGKATLTFAETECKGYLGKDFTAPALTIEPEGLTVKYASSDPDVALVNEKTGRVALMATGEVTITATVVSDQYEGRCHHTDKCHPVWLHRPEV